MAQASRSTRGLSDDPLENAADWFTANQKPLLLALAAVAVVVLLTVGYRYMDKSKRVDASTALYRAAAGLQRTERGPDPDSALSGVVKKYGGTAPGQQAAMLLAQFRYNQDKFAAGVAGLEEARGSATEEFAASFENLIAMGYQAQGKHEQAAEHFGKAALAARFAGDKGTYQAAQARELMAAGKLAEAKAIWEALAKLDDSQFNTEAQIRLGEIAGAAK